MTTQEGHDGPKGVECGLTKEVCAKSKQGSTCYTCPALPIVCYRLIHSEANLELSGRIKVLDCQEMSFFQIKNHERIIKTVGYWC